MKPIAALCCGIVLATFFLADFARAEGVKEYENRFRLMLDYAVRIDEYVRQRLGDKGLAAYAQAMAERNAAEAERMTPPQQYALLHPHLLLILENIERAFYFAARGNLDKYRYHEKTVRKEVQLLEAIAEREHIDLYVGGSRY